MSLRSVRPLVSYIAPAAPATRRPADGDQAFLRPEIGFTPAWFRQHAALDFGERFHRDPAYRRDCVVTMRRVLRQRFPGTRIGGMDRADEPLDLLTGVEGACTVAALYGRRVLYAADQWPTCAHDDLTDAQLARLEPPDLDRNPHWAQLWAQLDWIECHEGRLEGFINWQGVLNNAHRLRGQQVFIDLVTEPAKARHLCACVCETMLAGLERLRARQRATGVDYRFVTVSNCLVNLVSPRIYRELLWPFDQRLAQAYEGIGVHNCAWNATPYLEAYARLPGVAYLDLGLSSDLARAKALFPEARRALMYSPLDAHSKSPGEIQADLRRVAEEYAPCDLVLADLEAGIPDERVRAWVEWCRGVGRR
ncbi:MAG: hypothetical protein FJ387_25995 [Verrucomicrobia bacterium]|nr:hypothetical protein [Verrucomicrobiota bacterium]